MSTIRELEARLREQENNYLIKLAKARAEFESISVAFEICEPILRGQRRGNKASYTLVEKAIFRGKTFFDKVKSIRELSEKAISGDESNGARDGKN